MKKEVEILKIGTIIPDVISKWESSEGKKEGKSTIMVVFDGGHLFDHYVSILKEFCGDEYKYLKTAQSIVGTPNNLQFNIKKKGNTLKGISDGDPVVGQSYSIDSYWRTSTVVRIIDEDILITRNSVYAIHNPSKIRDKKLNDLGIN